MINAERKRARLVREIGEYADRLRALPPPGTAQERRAQTLIIRAMQSRLRALVILRAPKSKAPAGPERIQSHSSADRPTMPDG